MLNYSVAYKTFVLLPGAFYIFYSSDMLQFKPDSVLVSRCLGLLKKSAIFGILEVSPHVIEKR